MIKIASRIYDFTLSCKSKLVRRTRFLSQVAAASSPKSICNFGQSSNSQLQRRAKLQMSKCSFTQSCNSELQRALKLQMRVATLFKVANPSCNFVSKLQIAICNFGSKLQRKAQSCNSDLQLYSKLQIPLATLRGYFWIISRLFWRQKN